MASYVTLSEAATYLGVSKATLRNWDRSGKLRAVRDPMNRYRAYALSDLRRIQPRLPWREDAAPAPSKGPGLDARSTKALVSRLHNLIRDHDSHSNIIERFDELTKLLFLKLHTEAGDPNLFARKASESNAAYANRIRQAYERAADQNHHFVPTEFRQLLAKDLAICECAAALSQASFKVAGLDVKGLAYEEVVRNTFDKTDNQQFFTPPSIVRFVVDMMRPYLDGDICDPAAGTGGFLVEIIKSKCPYKSLTALEIDERLTWVAGMNLFAHDARNARVQWLRENGTLGHEAAPLLGEFDAIITNPPFGSDVGDPQLLREFVLGGGRTSRRRGILFLERCHQLLKPGGCLGFVIDEGVLNGNSTEDVRRFICEKFEIDAIASLPETAFMPYATVNASILFLRKLGRRRSRQVAQTFFAKAENVGRKGNGDDDIYYDESGSPRLRSDLPLIVDLYERFRMNGKVETSELAYSTTIDVENSKSSEGLRLDFRYHHPSRRLSERQLAGAKNRLMPLPEIADERTQSLIPSVDLADQSILYTGLANIESRTGVAHQVPTPANSLKSAVRRYEPGDIIFAKMRPNLRKVALMDKADGGYVSPECVVLSVRRDADGTPVIDPLLLSVLLRSDFVYGQIMHLIAGIGRPRLAPADLRRVLIPQTDREAQARWRHRYLERIRSASRARSKAAKLLASASAVEFAAVEQLAEEFS